MALTSKPLTAVRADLPLGAADDLVRVNIQTMKETRRQWKSAAMELDRSLAEFVHDAVSAWIAAKIKSKNN